MEARHRSNRSYGTSGTTNADRRGIYLAASNSGTIHHLYVRNCDIHHIRGFLSASDGDTAAKRTAGILVEVVDDTPTATRFNNILIEGCNIYSVTNEGIVAQNNKSSNSDYPGTTAWEARKITSLVIRNNTISDISKNAIIVRGADESCVIERNVCCNTATSDTGRKWRAASAK